MKIVLDHQIIKNFDKNAELWLKNPFIADQKNVLSLGWPSLLQLLELETIWTSLPAFDSTQPLFKACISTLFANEEKEVLFYVYDRLFAEILTQIKALPQIDAGFLLQSLREKRNKPSFTPREKVFSPAMDAYEVALTENTLPTMHHLILYLAWDRMCMYMNHLFNYPSSDPTFVMNLDVLKECLIESYQHITTQKKTSPGMYRMLEALLFYHLREENLQKHTEVEWNILSQSFPVLKAPNELVDFFYIDDEVISNQNLRAEEPPSICYLTLDSQEIVQRRLAFAQCMIDKLRRETSQWNYSLQNRDIMHLSLE